MQWKKINIGDLFATYETEVASTNWAAASREDTTADPGSIPVRAAG